MLSPQALKVLKTAEFMPFVVFIAAPELDTLRAMHKAVVDAGLTTKLLTVCFQVPLAFPRSGHLNNAPNIFASTGKRSEEDCGRERQDPPGLQPLLRPDDRQRQLGQGLRHAAGGCGAITHRATVGSRQLGLLTR